MRFIEGSRLNSRDLDTDCQSIRTYSHPGEKPDLGRAEAS